MWYQNQPYRRRRRRGAGFPFAFPFIILIFSHSLPVFFATLIVALTIFLIISALNATQNNAGSSMAYTPDPRVQRQTQTPYYQPSQPQTPYYQPYQPQEYGSYEQGYRPSPPPYQQNVQPAATPTYEDYEQPHAQYPEQMPPMQQP